jgi:hypothetical protein
MLLNELQKEYRRAEGQAEVIQAQEQEIENLKQQLQIQSASLQERLTRVEGLINSYRRPSLRRRTSSVGSRKLSGHAESDGL